MLAHLDLIGFFQLNAIFDPTTRSTREIIRRSDRAQLKRQVFTMKKWKIQVEPIGVGASGFIWFEHNEDGKERAVKEIPKAGTSLRTDDRQELQALCLLSKFSP